MQNGKDDKMMTLSSPFTLHPSPFPPLMTSDPGSFAERTIIERKPQIIQRVLEDNAYPPDIIYALGAFQNEIATRAIAPLREDAPDVEFWNVQQQTLTGRTWRNLPWYFAETYFYRRLLEAVQYFQPGPWRGYDPFATQKRAQEKAAIAQVETVWDDIEQLPPNTRFILLLHSCLWGNRADLSNFTVTESAHRGLDTHQEQQNLLIDDTDAVIALFQPQQMERQVTESTKEASVSSIETLAFVNDNVGMDTLFDLVLTDFLITQGWVQHVTFYLKNQPFFVSDALPRDIRLVIAQLMLSEMPAVAALGARLSDYIDTDRLHLDTDPFWTSYYTFWQLPAGIRAALGQTDLVILKGDVNYRRLLDDRHWPSTTPITTADADFPKPYLVLRTLKGEIVVNLQPGQAAVLTKEDVNWMINGKRGIIQVVR